ncbi:hypothetical protein PIROE2DRAFT_67901 [Piromyces sp. E2]|nr:hypothetical protein PIROE2DRAFT_67901 [Piromyces sp. E2]|eukprot:OUM56541.1 hypothetical protein PIROE2DRAFT_67901 [Piromyces sp. E2]
MAMDENGDVDGKKEAKIKVVSSLTNINKSTTTTTTTTDQSSFMTNPSSTHSDYDDESMDEVGKLPMVKTRSKEYTPSMCSSLSGISGVGHTPGKNALATLNSKFISFNLQTDRLKKKTQLLEENHSLGDELKKVQTKNFTLSEELASVRQENEDLKEENDRLLKELKALRAQLPTPTEE